MSRLTFLCLLITLTASGVLMASGAKSQSLKEVKVKVSSSGTSLKTVLDELEKQSGFSFYFTDKIGSIPRVAISKDASTLYDVLTEITNSKKLRYKQSGWMIAIMKPLEPGRISGKIVDDKGENLPGASIKIVELNKSIQSSVDGTYAFNVSPGTYTLEVSYVSFQTKRIAEVIVKEGQLTKLDVVLNTSSSALKEVVITSSFKRESVNGLYAQQKNNASMTDGISAEQIARTPDNNLGQVLRRVSGLSTIDTRYVVVRGMTERYNQAMLDGVIIPSTDMNRRNFSFDVVPQELVSNVVVNKTATPDQSAEFSGGQILINTLDIPTENFNSFTIGTGYNNRTTGKDFVQLGGRGKSDYLGFDDGRRNLPEDLQTWRRTQYTNGALPPFAIEQSKAFNNEQLKPYTYTATPNQNYRFSLGRLYQLKEELKFGFSGGLTYRNTQETNPFETIRNSGLAFSGRNDEPIDSASLKGTGNSHKFNTTLGGVLNMGIQGRTFRIALKNYYSHVFNETTQHASRFELDNNRRFLELFTVPEFTTVLQHKLEGENLLSSKGLQLNWSGALTNISQDIRDMRRLRYDKTGSFGGKDYYDTPTASVFSDGSGAYDYRLSTYLEEKDYNWLFSLSQPFNFLKNKSIVKMGYAGWHKHRSLRSDEVRIIKQDGGIPLLGRFEDIMAPDRIGATGDSAFYYADAGRNGSQYTGSSKYHSAYLMLDQRFFKRLRAVYGVRAENFNLANSQDQFLRDENNGFNSNQVDPFITGEKNWCFLPSVNLTYNLSDKMNIRAAYSTTMVRPDFRETSYFELFDPYLEAFISGWNVVSTKIQNYDLRYEWYPGVGEIISVSAFYKHFDKPLELMALSVTGGSGKSRFLRFQNQDKAINKGFEVEIRKSLGFIANKQWLRNITIFGNGTWMKSEVSAVFYQVVAVDNGASYKLVAKPTTDVKRPLYGQSPWILNTGINYNAKSFGANVNYNRSGYRSYVVDINPNAIEYENGRNLVDLQLSARLLKQKGEIKLNLSNLLDEATFFYTNPTAYSDPGSTDEGFKLVNGTDKYEKDKGDRITYRVKNGITASLTFTYKF